MIPAFGPSGVLPPFAGNDPADRPEVSPYPAKMSEIVDRFATTTERASILHGLLDYRAALTSLGIVSGFQWIDGSFVEDCETIRSRPPGDVDLVTFAYRPSSTSSPSTWQQFCARNSNLFDPDATKKAFRCDAYFIDLTKTPHLIVADTAYFHGLFSHQRDTSQWKGMLQVDLHSDDMAARQLI